MIITLGTKLKINYQMQGTRIFLNERLLFFLSCLLLEKKIFVIVKIVIEPLGQG